MTSEDEGIPSVEEVFEIPAKDVVKLREIGRGSFYINPSNDTISCITQSTTSLFHFLTKNESCRENGPLSAELNLS